LSEIHHKYQGVRVITLGVVLLLVLLLAGAWGGLARTRADSSRAH
jgi:hypothetical protein